MCEPTNDYEQQIKAIDGMDGHEFEHLCSKLLMRNGFSNVEVTRGSGDQGVDIVADKDGIKYAIQCKNYASHLSNKPVQEVVAGKHHYNCHVGAVLTNSFFTTGAKELAESNNVILWDRIKLQEMLAIAGGLESIGYGHLIENKNLSVNTPTTIPAQATFNEAEQTQNFVSPIKLPPKRRLLWAVFSGISGVSSLFFLLMIPAGIFTKDKGIAFSGLGIFLFLFILAWMFRKLTYSEKAEKTLAAFGRRFDKPSFVAITVSVAVLAFFICVMLS